MKNAVRMSALIAIATAAVAGCNAENGSAASPSTSRATTTVAASAPQTPGEQPRATEAPGGNGLSGGTQAPVVTEAPPVTAAPGTTKPQPADDISGPGRCIDPQSTGVRNALARLDGNWVAQQASADLPGQCAQLLWVRAVGGNSAGAPIHVLFFHDGKWLGTATSEAYAFTSVVGYTDTTVTVEYKWLAGDEPFAAPQGGPVAIHYTWNGSNVVMSGPLPKEVTQPHR
ncbi:LppP/LprE family lipoprotein [Nocardia sp. NPDC051833]|uniref:LppP/LprE family lipoprotein n=1 Tax=Nocardia sp. NPDC051833 TaxID=3155674 RepID=UPI00343E5695